MSAETATQLNEFGQTRLPGLLGVEILEAEPHVVVGRAVPVHLGGTTQVWDATISNQTSGKTIALFRCAQLILQRRG